MSDYIGNFISGPAQVSALLSVALIWLGMAAIGAALVGRHRMAEVDHLVGWGGVSFLMTLPGVYFGLPFGYAALAAAGLALGSLVYVGWRERRIVAPGWGRVLLVGLPLLVLVSAMRGSQWDEFGTWLMVPRYMLETGAFPSATNPYANAFLPGYPYNWHFVTYLASRISGGLLENAGALSNVVLLYGFGLVLIRLIEAGTARNIPAGRPAWAIAALVVLATTLINPAFAQKVVLTSYAETSTAVATATAVVLAWMLLERLAGDGTGNARALAWQLGLVLALLVNLKQATLVLAVLVVLAALVVALRDPAVPAGGLVRLLPAIVLPPAILYLTWRYHLAAALPATELSVRPLDEWAVDLTAQVLWKMLVVLSKKGYFLALMLILAGCGVFGFIKARTALDRLAMLAALVVLGYNAFLLFAYVTTFTRFDALRVASFWRYNMHLGLVLVAFTVYGLAVQWGRRGGARFDLRRWAWVPVVLVIAAPFVFAHKLRFDRVPAIAHYRSVGAELAPLMRAGDGLYISDPRGSGESGVITKFELDGGVRVMGWVTAFSPDKLAPLTRAIASPGTTAILVYSTFDGYEAAFGMALAAGRTHLLRRADGGGWKVVKSWLQPAPE